MSDGSQASRAAPRGVDNSTSSLDQITLSNTKLIWFVDLLGHGNDAANAPYGEYVLGR
jgi:hypothetical protein